MAPNDSVFKPFSNKLFAYLWFASFASLIGTWIHDIGASWLMATLEPRPIMVSLIQASNAIPLFALAIPAGVIADIFDRRKLLIVTQVWMFLVALILSIMSFQGLVGPFSILFFTFLMGIGAAMNGPAWQSMIPFIVSKEDLHSAITLQGAAINGARAIGPAIGGFLVAYFGSSAAFLLNAISFLAIIYVLATNKFEKNSESQLPSEYFVPALKSGFRFVMHSDPFKRVLIKSALFIFFASSIWAFLPLIVKINLGKQASDLGMLTAMIGLGAVSLVFLVKKTRTMFSDNLAVLIASLVIGIIYITISQFSNFYFYMLLLYFLGICWLLAISTLTTSSQYYLPNWVRSRAIAFSVVVFFGGTSLGSLFWGCVAELTSISTALLISGSALIITALISYKIPIESSGDLDLSPSLHWENPIVNMQIEQDQGPVKVLVEYVVKPEHENDFLKSMTELKYLRLQSGALRWTLYKDLEKPDNYHETFILDSWVEHLRQHERVSFEDRKIQEKVREYLAAKPIVKHMVFIR